MSRSKLNYGVYNGKNFKKIFENSRTLLLGIMFSLGIMFGASAINSGNIITEKISEFADSYIIIKSGQGIPEIFLNSIISNMIFLILNVFLSFSLIGYPMLFFIPLLKGLGTGIVCGYMYSVYGFSGFGYCALTIIPGTIVSTYALITACNNSCEYSKNAFLKSILGKGQFEKGETKIFLTRQIIFAGICIISSLTDAVFSYVFLRFFEF